MASGERRKRKKKRQGRSKRPFLVIEAGISDDDSEDDEDSDDCDEIEGLINDDDMEERDNASFYRAFDNERPRPSSATQPPENVVLSAEDRQVEEKRLKKVKACLSRKRPSFTTCPCKSVWQCTPMLSYACWNFWSSSTHFW